MKNKVKNVIKFSTTAKKGAWTSGSWQLESGRVPTCEPADEEIFEKEFH